MKFKEALELYEAIRFFPVLKKDVKRAKPKDLIKTPMGRKYKRPKDSFLVKHPTKPDMFLYIKKRPQSKLINDPNSNGFMGFMYEIDRAAAKQRSIQARRTAKRTSVKRAKSAARTRRLNR